MPIDVATLDLYAELRAIDATAPLGFRAADRPMQVAGGRLARLRRIRPPAREPLSSGGGGRLPVKTVIASVVAVVALGVVAQAQAETRTFGEAKIRVDLPVGWRVESRGAQIIAEDPKNEATAMIRTVAASDARRAEAALDADVARIVGDVRWEQPRAITVNGLKAQSRQGHGRSQGKPVQLSTLVVAAPVPGRFLIVSMMAQAATAAAHKPAFHTIANTIRPVGSGRESR